MMKLKIKDRFADPRRHREYWTVPTWLAGFAAGIIVMFMLWPTINHEFVDPVTFVGPKFIVALAMFSALIVTIDIVQMTRNWVLIYRWRKLNLHDCNTHEPYCTGYDTVEMNERDGD